MSDEQYNMPLISEAADPLTHLTGNEYELGWRSVWIITPRGNKVRVLETPEGHIETVVRSAGAYSGNGNSEPRVQGVGDHNTIDPEAEPPFTVSA